MAVDEPVQRTPRFARNLELERLLEEINSDMGPVEEKLIGAYAQPSKPVIFVFGPLRSGTTLFMQWLANTGMVAYPTNLLSRFYAAPIMGAKIQLLLTDPRYRFRNELDGVVSSVGYESENGKTGGVLAPNEFWYFWRRFLADPARDVWSDDELRQTLDSRTMLAELAGLTAVFGKPFAAKGMLFNYNIRLLDELFDKALFIQIKRDLTTNVASALEARRRQLGSEAAWYSFRIPEYEALLGLDPVSQVAGQIHFINRAVDAGMAAIADDRKLIVSYENFCCDPSLIFETLRERLGLSADADYEGAVNFRVSRAASPALAKQVLRAVERLEAPDR